MPRSRALESQGTHFGLLNEFWFLTFLSGSGLSGNYEGTDFGRVKNMGLRCSGTPISVYLPAPTIVTTPDATRYPASMAPIATVIAWIPAIITVRTIVTVSSVMRIPVSVAVMAITPRADVDINLCRCVTRRKHRQSNKGSCSRINSQ
jgi:hypothetical protein